MANYYHETRKLLNTEYKFNYRGTADRYAQQIDTHTKWKQKILFHLWKIQNHSCNTFCLEWKQMKSSFCTVTIVTKVFPYNKCIIFVKSQPGIANLLEAYNKIQSWNEITIYFNLFENDLDSKANCFCCNVCNVRCTLACYPDLYHDLKIVEYL